MKLLENAKLDGIIAALCMDMGDCKISGRVESYSCRMAGNDKKLYKQQSHQEGQEPQALSPPQPFIIGSPVTTVGSPITPTGGCGGIPPVFIRSASSSSSGAGKGTGPQLWCDTISAKTLFYLRSTLTASFQPDYDFTDAKSEQFSREPNVKLVKDAVRSNLSALAGDTFISLELQLWAAIDEEIKLSDCDIYSYNADFPYEEEGALWAFNYFFYNKKLKRILFFSCIAMSPSADTESLEDLTEEMEFEQQNDSAYDSFTSGI